MGAHPAVNVPEVLGALVDRDSRALITLTFGEDAHLLPADSRAVDDALLEAHRTGLMEGDRGEGDGSVAWWSQVRLTVRGLQCLGQWPPVGREWADGLWEDGYWGRRVRPQLRRLVDGPPPGDFYLKPHSADGDAQWLDWTAVLMLRDAGLVSGRLDDGGFDTVRVTPQGREALDPTPRDPLDEAEAELRNGARVDAIVTAVEAGLAPRLRAIAARLGLATTRLDGQPLRVARINDEVKAAGGYDETVRAQVDAWLKLRNDLAHATDAAVSPARVAVAVALAGIRVFLDEHAA